MDDGAGPAEGYGNPIFLKAMPSKQIVLLPPGTRVAFSGEVTLTVLGGVVDVCGHVVRQGSPSLSMASTMATALITVYPVQPRNGQGHPGKSGLGSGLAKMCTEVARDRGVDPNSIAVVEFQCARKRSALRALLERENKREYRDLYEPDIDRDDDVSYRCFDGFVLYQNSTTLFKDTATIGRPFEHDAPWDDVFDQFAAVCDTKLDGDRGGVILVCGGKDAGKSTFARWMVNRLLSRYPSVDYIDLDPGQTEFGPPGLVSHTVVKSPVFGAPFTHLQPPHDARFIGAASPKGDPAGYFEAVTDLLQQHVDRSLAAAGARTPTVVNTSGWVRGLGLELLLDTIRVAVPDIVVQFQTSASSRNLPALTPMPPPSLDLWPVHPVVTTGVEPRVLLLDAALSMDTLPQKGKSFHYAPKNLRELALLAYFTDGDGDAQGSMSPPWRVPLDAVDVAAPIGATVTDTEVLRVLNGLIVGLLAAAPAEDSAHRRVGAVVPVSRTSRCHGLGIVRAATRGESDGDASEVFVSTPVAMDTHCPRVVAIGDIEVPETMLSLGGPYLSDFPSGGTVGAHGRKVRRNIGRKHAPA
eukprot:m.102725 g.102725  ORF g.102725 m.102725 type:complete len:582 (-) comp10446_c1_seq3:1335-3080(-)